MNLLLQRFSAALLLSAIVSSCVQAHAQTPQDRTPVQNAPAQSTPVPATQDSAEPTAPQGKVLFQSHGDAPVATEPGTQPAAQASQPKPAGPELTDTERSAITITAYDLDARVTPATSRLGMRAKLTLRNDGDQPLTRVALQISSSLNWEGASLVAPEGSSKLELGQHLLDTDTDHTGRASEAVIALPSTLAPGQTVTLDTFYSGEVTVNTDRLQRIGATQEQALAADWDSIVHDHTAIRGFGNVLWYPVASPQVFLGDGAQLFEAIGHMELREQNATIRLRVGIEYRGDPPAAVYFCGRREPLKAVADDPNMPISGATGFALAEFAAQPLGFRLPSLVIVERNETMVAPAPELHEKTPAESSSSSSSSTEIATETADTPALTATGSSMLAVETDDSSSVDALAKNAESVAPLLVKWLGTKPLSALTIVDHGGQPFEDGPLLLAPVKSLADASAQAALTHSLTHAWVQTGEPWMDEGLAQFFAVLSTEQVSGRDAAVLQLSNLLQPLAIAEPELEADKPGPVGQPLVAATSEIFFRRKAAVVWYMLRGLAGDKALQATLQTWRVREPVHATAEQDALAFEALLEKNSGKDLHWFFDDWVLHDRGLPDLSITDVTPHMLPAGSGHGGNWLVSVTVHNQGGAAAEVPVIIRSGTFSTTSPLHLPAFGNATARVLVEAAPTEVVVNDGSTPEVSASIHKRTIAAAPAQ